MQLINEHSLIPSMEISSEVLILIKNKCREFEKLEPQDTFSELRTPSAACVCVFKWCLTKESGQTYKFALGFFRTPVFSTP